MPVITLSRPGQVNSAGDDEALFLIQFAGEVLTAFGEKNVAMDAFQKRTITDTNGATFPATWKATAAYHTPGDDIAGQTINHNERRIYVDDLLVAAVWIHKIDELKNYWDVRGEYARQLGAALARVYDRHVLQTAILAARASAVVTGGNGGTILTNAAAATDPQAFVDTIAASGQAMFEKDVPDGDRSLFVKPATYSMLWNSDIRAIHRDFTAIQGNNQTDGMIMRIGGFNIKQTNNLPTGVINTGPTAYQGDFTNTLAVACHRSAIGTVELMGMSSEMQYWPTRKATYLDASMAIGHGILRPESSVEFRVA
jgi:hypothetical protein